MKKSVLLFLAAATVVLVLFAAPALAGLPAPKGVAATVTSATQVKVTWGKVTGATGYQVWRTGGASAKFVKVASVKSVSWTNRSLTGNTRYGYKVRATKGKAAGSYSRVSSVVTTIPATPIASPGGIHAIYLSWDELPGAASYQVWRRTGSGSFSKVATVSDVSYDSTGLQAGTQYGYKIRATIGGALTGYSAVATERTASTSQDLPAPGSFAVSTRNFWSVNLSWDGVQNAVTYRIYYSKDSGASLGAWDHTDFVGTACYLWGLDAGTTYYFRVAAVDSGGTAGTPTGFLPCSTDPDPGTPPTPKFYLNDLEDHGSYYRMNFYRSTSPIYSSYYDPSFDMFTGVSLSTLVWDASADTSQYFYYDMAPGSSRWFRFTANWGPYASPPQDMQIAALGQPQNVQADGLHWLGDVHMSWNAVPFAAKYRIYWAPAGPYPGQSWPDFRTSELAAGHLHLYGTQTGTSAVLSGLPESLTTYFFVVPCDSSGVESWFMGYAITGVYKG